MATEELDRRRYLAALTAVGSVGLAGCEGGTDGEDNVGAGGGQDNGETGTQDLGERVPMQPVHVYGGLGSTTALEEASGHVAEVLRQLGVESEVSVLDPTTLRSNLFNDAREHNYEFDYKAATPERLDPDSIFNQYTIAKAGANGQPNPTNYASCEFSRLFLEQRRADSEEERYDLIQEALETASQDIEQINVTAQVSSGAYRSDQLELRNVGEMGISELNHVMLRTSVPTGDNPKSINVSDVHMGTMYPAVLPDLWGHTVFSSLVYFDHNREIQNSLATDYEVESNFTQFTFTLREDATFHDGSPVTAEDVKYTYEFLEQNSAEVTTARVQDYESIDVIDEHTVQINFNSPSPTFINTHVARWGIVPREHYIENNAGDNPGNPDIDPVIGSGPYQVVNLDLNQILQLEPYEDHWETAEGNLNVVRYTDISAAYRAFQQGDLNIFTSIPVGTSEQIESGMDNAVVQRSTSYIPTSIYPQHTFDTSKFREFRHALSQGLDRQLLNEIITYGYADIHQYSSMLYKNHPYYPDDHGNLTKIADSPTGDIERAREILRENGWGWDEDGNLHFPPDADRTMWPQGSEPEEHPDKFPCVTELDLPGFES